MITGAVGGAAGFFGNLAYQLYANGGSLKCVKWKDAGIAGLSGAAAGALLPLTGTTTLGAIGTGAITNVGGYAATQAANGESLSWQGGLTSAVAGAIGGGIAGKLNNPYWFARGLSPWPGAADLAAANTDRLTIGRAVAGAAVSSDDPIPCPECGCK